MAFQRPFLIILKREDTKEPWGFRVCGGADLGTTPTVDKVVEDGIAARHGIHDGDLLIQIGKHNVEDLTEARINSILAYPVNRLEVFIVREDFLQKPRKGEPSTVKAVVHNQYNSPLPLYSQEKVAETLVLTAQALTEEDRVNDIQPVGLPRSFVHSAVFQAVNEEESAHRSANATTAAPRKAAAPPPPPKTRPPVYSGGTVEHQRQPSSSSYTVSSHPGTPRTPPVQQPAFQQLRSPQSPYQHISQPAFYQNGYHQQFQTQHSRQDSYEQQQRAHQIQEAELRQRLYEEERQKQAEYEQQRFRQLEAQRQRQLQSSYQEEVRGSEDESRREQERLRRLYQEEEHRRQLQEWERQREEAEKRRQQQQYLEQRRREEEQRKFEEQRRLEQQKRLEEQRKLEEQRRQQETYRAWQEEQQRAQRVAGVTGGTAPTTQQAQPQKYHQPQQYQQQQYQQQQYQQQQYQQQQVQQQQLQQQRQPVSRQWTYEEKRPASTPLTSSHQHQDQVGLQTQQWEQKIRDERSRMSFSPQDSPSTRRRDAAWPPKESNVRWVPKTGFSPDFTRQSSKDSKRFIWPPPNHGESHGEVDGPARPPSRSAMNAWHPSSPSATTRTPPFARSPSLGRRTRDIAWPPPQPEAAPKPVPKSLNRGFHQAEEYMHHHASCGVPATYRAPPNSSQYLHQ